VPDLTSRPPNRGRTPALLLSDKEVISPAKTHHLVNPENAFAKKIAGMCEKNLYL
jgi:hypothetical protein